MVSLFIVSVCMQRTTWVNENDGDDEDDEEATVIKSRTGQRGTSQR